MLQDFSNFGSLKSTETATRDVGYGHNPHFSNFGSLKSTETLTRQARTALVMDFSNFGSLKSTETQKYYYRLCNRSTISAISAR